MIKPLRILLKLPYLLWILIMLIAFGILVFPFMLAKTLRNFWQWLTDMVGALDELPEWWEKK